MEIQKYLNPKGIAILLGFAVLVAVADNFNFSSLYGASNQFFTLFQLFAPAVGGFLGAGAGILTVLAAEIFSFLFNGKELNLLNLLRLAPMLFGVAYFALYAGKNKLAVVVPLVCFGLFILHPVGSQAWYYALYWLIPAIALLAPRNLLLRSYGATFSAHAVGGIIWLYTLPSAPEFWIALIPVVAFERTVFAAGISASYYAWNTVLAKLPVLEKFVKVERQYAFRL